MTNSNDDLRKLADELSANLACCEQWERDTILTALQSVQRAEREKAEGLREALDRAQTKLEAYVGVCKDDKELTTAVLPLIAKNLATYEASKTTKTVNYPDWICSDCGNKHGQRPFGLATWHVGTCDICGKGAPVTEPRDFGHLKETWGKK